MVNSWLSFEPVILELARAVQAYLNLSHDKERRSGEPRSGRDFQRLSWSRKRRSRKTPLSPSPLLAGILSAVVEFNQAPRLTDKAVARCIILRGNRAVSRESIICVVLGTPIVRTTPRSGLRVHSKDGRYNNLIHSKARRRQRQPCLLRPHLRCRHRRHLAVSDGAPHPQHSWASEDAQLVPGHSRPTSRCRRVQTTGRRKLQHTRWWALQWQPFLRFSWALSILHGTPTFHLYHRARPCFALLDPNQRNRKLIGNVPVTATTSQGQSEIIRIPIGAALPSVLIGCVRRKKLGMDVTAGLRGYLAGY